MRFFSGTGHDHRTGDVRFPTGGNPLASLAMGHRFAVCSRFVLGQMDGAQINQTASSPRPSGGRAFAFLKRRCRLIRDRPQTVGNRPGRLRPGPYRYRRPVQQPFKPQEAGSLFRKLIREPAFSARSVRLPNLHTPLQDPPFGLVPIGLPFASRPPPSHYWAGCSGNTSRAVNANCSKPLSGWSP